jgi:hypothetical protein
MYLRFVSFFLVLTLETAQIMISWFVTMCNLVGWYRRFGGTLNLNL